MGESWRRGELSTGRVALRRRTGGGALPHADLRVMFPLPPTMLEDLRSNNYQIRAKVIHRRKLQS